MNGTQLCFFLISVTYTIGWTTISSELAYYKSLFGPSILLQLNLAYFLPSIPILVLQTYLDEHFDRQFGPGKATAFRFSFAIGGILGVSLAYPLLPEHRAPILACVALLGVASGILFGSSYQLVSRFPTSNTVALTLGYVASGPLVLLLNFVLGIGPHATLWQRTALFASVTIVVLSGLCAMLYIFSRHWAMLEHGATSSTRDAAPEACPLVGHDEEDRGGMERLRLSRPHKDEDSEWLSWAPYNGQAPTSFPPRAVGPAAPPSRSPSVIKRDASMATSHVLEAIAVPAVVLCSSIATSVLIFPFFTYVPSSGHMAEFLPQRLFAARVTADILGRVLPKRALVRSDAPMLALAALKVLMTPLFFLYIDGRLAWRSDVVAVGYVFAFWWLSGYLNTCAYVCAPVRAPSSGGPRAGALMALLFQLSSLLALLLAEGVQLMMFQKSPGA